MDHKVTIVIPSCDAYQDAWQPFFYCLNRNWKDCPFEKVIITNFLDSPDPDTKAIKVGIDVDYCSNLKLALQQIDSDYIILWLEDLLLGAIPNCDFQLIFDQAIRMEAGYLKLWQLSSASERQGQLLKEIPKEGRFRVSLKPAFWKKSLLESLIIPGESPFDLERKGSVRSCEYQEKFLSLTPDAKEFRLSTINLIHRGKYESVALNYLQKIGCEFDSSKRPIRSRLVYLFKHNMLNPILRRFKLLGV